MEELFLFHYHMHMSRADALSMPVFERKWVLNRFVEQKEKENEAMDKARKKGR